MDIHVIGGGIGGLVAAIALTRRGHAVRLSERAPAFAPVGAGIILGANATAILRKLGVDLGAGYRLGAMDVCGPGGRVLSGLPVERMGYEVLAFHRAELHAALVAVLPSAVRLELGVEAKDDGSGDLVVGADGLRSAVREAAVGPVRMRYSGETCWRAIVPGVRVERCTENWADQARMGIVPITGDRVYVFLTRVRPQGEPTPPWSEMRAWYAALGGDCPAVLDRIDPGTLIHHDLVELDAPCWGRERVWLIGDAAHGMTPNQGQGAAMAIEDAAMLAEKLGEGHAAYVAARHDRVRKVQLDSRRFGQAAAVGLAPLQWLRNQVAAWTPASVTDGHYRTLVAPGLAIAERL